jgi:hypothetical protein
LFLETNIKNENQTEWSIEQAYTGNGFNEKAFFTVSCKINRN